MVVPVNFVTLYAYYCHGITAIIILTEKILIKYISQSRNSDLTMRLSELAYSPVKKDNKIEGWKLFIEHVPEKYQRDTNDKVSQLDNELWGIERKA